MPLNLSRNTKIFIGWGVIVAVGIYGFVYSKRLVVQRRYDNMKIRERMRNSNVGDYERSERFSHVKTE